MRLRASTPAAVGACLFLLALLWPAAMPLPHRDLGRDIDGLRQAECEYRGITATYEDVTRAYLLETFADGHVQGWRGTPSPRNPDTETLVTAWCRLGSPLPAAQEAAPDTVRQRRREAVPWAPVTWRYSTLAAVRIEAGNHLAADAITVFRRTVDRFIRAMVVTAGPALLRTAAAASADTLQQLAAGTVLLLEDPPAGAVAGWSYVRVPATTRRGWLPEDSLTRVEDEH